MNEHYYKILGTLDAYLNSPGVQTLVEGNQSLKDAFAILNEARDRYRAAGARVEAALQKFDEEGGNTETGIGRLILDALTTLRDLTFPAAGPSVAAALEQIVSDINSTARATTNSSTNSTTRALTRAPIEPSTNIKWPRSSSNGR